MDQNYLSTLFKSIQTEIQTVSQRLAKETQPDLGQIKAMLAQLDPQLARDAAQNASGIAAIPLVGDGAEHPAAIFDCDPALAGQSVGVDGSQIYPNSRDLMPWGLTRAVSVGSEGGRFEISQFLGEEFLAKVPNKGRAMVDAHREMLEAQLIAQLAGDPAYANQLILTDGGLLPWSAMDAEFDFLASEYRRNMEAAIQTGLVAGVVSHPRSKYLYNLLNACYPGKLPVFSDNALMNSHLAVGERSAVFMHGSGINPSGVSAVYHFYLRATESEVMRVEIPATLAFNRAAVDRVHATLLENSRALGYPAVLIGAHEAVKITAKEAHELQQEVRMQLLREVGADALPALSVKEILKGEERYV